jgi:hypothetical protein|eukprot:g3425.t1
MTSVVNGAFFMEGTDSDEEGGDNPGDYDGSQVQTKRNQTSQEFQAFAARMQSLGYREQSGLLSETASQNSFNQGFGDAARGAMENGFVEGRRHAKEFSGGSAMGEKPAKRPPRSAKAFLEVGLAANMKHKGGGTEE